MADIIPGIASDEAIAVEHGLEFNPLRPSHPKKSTKVKPLTTADVKAKKPRKAKKASAKKAARKPK